MSFPFRAVYLKGQNKSAVKGDEVSNDLNIFHFDLKLEIYGEGEQWGRAVWLYVNTQSGEPGQCYQDSIQIKSATFGNRMKNLGSSTCAHCAQECKKGVVTKNKIWHLGCFRCGVCMRSLILGEDKISELTPREDNGNVFCASHAPIGHKICVIQFEKKTEISKMTSTSNDTLIDLPKNDPHSPQDLYYNNAAFYYILRPKLKVFNGKFVTLNIDSFSTEEEASNSGSLANYVAKFNDEAFWKSFVTAPLNIEDDVLDLKTNTQSIQSRYFNNACYYWTLREHLPRSWSNRFISVDVDYFSNEVEAEGKSKLTTFITKIGDETYWKKNILLITTPTLPPLSARQNVSSYPFFFYSDDEESGGHLWGDFAASWPPPQASDFVLRALRDTGSPISFIDRKTRGNQAPFYFPRDGDIWKLSLCNKLVRLRRAPNVLQNLLVISP